MPPQTYNFLASYPPPEYLGIAARIGIVILADYSPDLKEQKRITGNEINEIGTKTLIIAQV